MQNKDFRKVSYSTFVGIVLLVLFSCKAKGTLDAAACTYQVNGKQYLALSVGGTIKNPSGFIMAFTLP